MNPFDCKGLLLLAAIVAGGCAVSPHSAPTTRPATAIDPVYGKSDYWFAKPGIVHVACTNFDSLWDNSVRVAHSNYFVIDRQNYRQGLLTTRPLISKQFFEPWRSDVGDFHSLLQSSLGTVRRTIHFDIRKLPDGSYTATPKVLVERHSVAEHRITSVTQYQDVFSTDRPLEETSDEEGATVVPDYWFAIGRDYALERDLADQLRGDLPSELCQE
jgi:hypothetical protein